jgi:hypothetical protein
MHVNVSRYPTWRSRSALRREGSPDDGSEKGLTNTEVGPGITAISTSGSVLSTAASPWLVCIKGLSHHDDVAALIQEGRSSADPRSQFTESTASLISLQLSRAFPALNHPSGLLKRFEATK